MEQQPPSRIEELEHLVSNLRRDLQVAHDALQRHKSSLDKAREALSGLQYSAGDILFGRAGGNTALAAINEVLK